MIEEKCYLSIDEMPIYNWRKLHEQNDYLFVVKPDFISEIRKSVTPEITKEINLIWERIFAEFIDKFGFNEAFLVIFRKEKKIAQLVAEMELTDDASIETAIEIENFNLEQFKKQTEGGTSFLEIKAMIEMNMHFQINERVTTVEEFYTYLKMIQDKSNG